jgi:hypothetical protein
VGFVASVARGLLVRMGAVFDERGTLLPYGTQIAKPAANAVDDHASPLLAKDDPS